MGRDGGAGETATGSGASGRRILGTVVIVGMLAATMLAIFLIPATFYVVEKLSGSKRKTLTAAPDVPEPAPGD